jgi:hypothetical protein
LKGPYEVAKVVLNVACFDKELTYTPLCIVHFRLFSKINTKVQRTEKYYETHPF